MAQAIDYTYAMFEIRGVYIYPAAILLFPMVPRFGCGPLESVAVQNNIGTMSKSGLIWLGLNLIDPQDIEIGLKPIENMSMRKQMEKLVISIFLTCGFQV